MAASRKCLSDAALARLAEGTATREEVRAAVAHLLRGCPDCSAKLLGEVRPPVAAGAYDAALDRFEDGLRAALEAPVGPLSRLWTVTASLQESSRIPLTVSRLDCRSPARSLR